MILEYPEEQYELLKIGLEKIINYKKITIDYFKRNDYRYFDIYFLVFANYEYSDNNRYIIKVDGERLLPYLFTPNSKRKFILYPNKKLTENDIIVITKKLIKQILN